MQLEFVVQGKKKLFYGFSVMLDNKKWSPKKYYDCPIQNQEKKKTREISFSNGIHWGIEWNLNFSRQNNAYAP